MSFSAKTINSNMFDGVFDYEGKREYEQLKESEE